ELNKELIKGLKAQGIDKPTKIQEKAIPLIIENKDLLGQSATGERVIIVIGCINTLISRVSGTFIKNNSCIA
ncbi:MAG: DEAD/DEAH box helicase, partial [Epulopiscium sp.]|nr:DEAD/DEAH box helicase [Candidatus Epulonipiscium sp.]